MFLEQLFCWFTSYLEGTQTVKAGNVISAPGLLLYRVPHGSVLGSSLFSVYTVPVLAIAVGRGIVVINLLLGLRETVDLLTENRVKLNIYKDLLLYTIPESRSAGVQPLLLKTGDCTLVSSDSVRNLDILLDSNLTMVPHVNSVT